MEQMYKGIPFSPTATLTGNIAATDAIIPVSNVDAFPDAPNIATIGSISGPNETIIYTGKTATSLVGCTRGVEGTASDWAIDELIGRNFTAKDHADMVKNIEELENSKLDASYKVDVVNTADVTIAGKALDARQNNPNIAGTLAQKVDSNTQQINDLNKYKPTASTATNTTLLGYIINEINKGILSGYFSAINCSDLPAQGWGFSAHYSIVEGEIYEVTLIEAARNNRYIRDFRVSSGWEQNDWEQIVTKSMLNNALAINNLTRV